MYTQPGSEAVRGLAKVSEPWVVLATEPADRLRAFVPQKLSAVAAERKI